jgi:hypothetical protein
VGPGWGDFLPFLSLTVGSDEDKMMMMMMMMTYILHIAMENMSVSFEMLIAGSQFT